MFVSENKCQRGVISYANLSNVCWKLSREVELHSYFFYILLIYFSHKVSESKNYNI